MDLQAEGAGAAGQGLADPAHADDAQLGPARRRPSIQVGVQPAKPPAWTSVGALDQPAGHGHDQGHGHVGGVFGEHAGRVGDGDAARVGGGDVDIVDPGPEIGDQPQLRPGLARGRRRCGR